MFAEFPAGDLIKLLVGFTNNGEKDFIVETIDASFRYPQDFSFYIQNVSCPS
jgi:translocon-associated protein subunit alpha